MKKLVSLLLALVCLCSLLPAAAEEADLPALTLPVALADYQAAYEALLADVVPGCTVSWTSAPMEGGECYMALVNDSFIGVMVLEADGQAQEVAVLMQSALDEDSLMTFLSLAGYAGAALLRSDEVSSVTACNAFVGELYTVFSIMTAGGQSESIYGLPGGVSISPLEDGSYQYYFVLQLTPAE